MTQQTLFDVEPNMRFRGAGHRRTHMGAVMEEVVCGLLGFTRAKTGGQGAYQPDAHNPNDLPVEIKSVCINSKLKGKSVLYDFRMEKDRVHAPALAYVFACHLSGGKGKAKTMGDFLDRLEASLVLSIVPAWIVRMDAKQCTLCTIKSKVTHSKRCGYTREGYSDGYRNLEVHRYIRDAERIEEVEFERWGRRFSAAALYFKPDPWQSSPAGQ